jgi:hypothetical protein
MNVDKKLEKLEDKIKEIKDSKKVKVVSLTRKHFKKQLSTSMGIGYQDMKKKPKKLFNSLINKGYNIHTEPVNVSNMELDIYVILK